jgi:hypothetical protein
LFDKNEINKQNIFQAKQNKVNRVLEETGKILNINDISNTDLVFRVMTWEHIPMLPPKVVKPIKKKKKLVKSIDSFFENVSDNVQSEIEDNEIEHIPEVKAITNIKADHIRINFPPFFHYRLNNENIPYVVGKSHWKGSLEDGEYCKTHGELTDTLARMIMKLVEKYASKGKFRYYTYREEMEGQAVMQLVQVALQFDESKSQNPFSFFTACAFNSFRRILNIEKKNQELRDKILSENNINPSYSYTNKNSSIDSID